MNLPGPATAPPHRSRQPIGLTSLGQWLASAVAMVVLLLLFAWLRNGAIATEYRVLAALYLFVSLPVYLGLHAYDWRNGYLNGALRIALAWFIVLSLLAIVGFVTKTSASFSREALLRWAGFGLLAQYALYLPLHTVSRRFHLGLLHELKALLVADGDPSVELIEGLSAQGQRIVGYVDIQRTRQAETPESSRKADVITNIRTLMAQHGVRRIYIQMPLQRAEQLQKLYVDLLDLNVDIIWVPDFGSMQLLNKSVSDIAGLPAIHLNESPFARYPTSAFLKLCFDRIAAAIGLVILSPLLLAIAAGVKLSSPGPVLFKQKRHGWNGEVIEVWKFRTMREHADDGVKQATPGDPRITPFGRFLRRTSLDELPQLVNVLTGHMSLVGPRPHAVEHNDHYSKQINAYMARHRIKPGITGLAQVNGLRGQTDTPEKMEQRIAHDLAYIQNWSLWLDFKILLKTPAVLYRGGAY